MGRFAFSALPEGRFNLSASKPGHISRLLRAAPAGPARHANPARRRPASPGATADHAAAASSPAPCSTKTPRRIPGTPVRALRYVMQSGAADAGSRPGTAATDDRGVYRIYGLQPGEYIVFATPRNANSQGVERAVRSELQQLVQQSEVMARMEAVQAQAAQALAERIAQLRASMPAQVDGRRGRDRLRARLLSGHDRRRRAPRR